MKKRILIFFILLAIIMPTLIMVPSVKAADDKQQTIINNPLDPTNTKITNENKQDIGVFWERVVKAILILIGSVSLVIFIYAGFIFLVSAGNVEKTKKARDTLLYAVLGIFLATATYAILSFVFKTFETSVRDTSSGQPTQVINTGNQAQ